MVLWKKGPFEMLDALGPSWFADKLKSEGLEVPKILEIIGDGHFYSEKGNNLNYFTIDGEYANGSKARGLSFSFGY